MKLEKSPHTRWHCNKAWRPLSWLSWHTGQGDALMRPRCLPLFYITAIYMLCRSSQASLGPAPRKISLSLEATRLVVQVITSFWNLAGASAAVCRNTCQISERFCYSEILKTNLAASIPSRDLAIKHFIGYWNGAQPGRWGDRLNIKMSSYQYRDPHVKDKTLSQPSYL